MAKNVYPKLAMCKVHTIPRNQEEVAKQLWDKFLESGLPTIAFAKGLPFLKSSKRKVEPYDTDYFYNSANLKIVTNPETGRINDNRTYKKEKAGELDIFIRQLEKQEITDILFCGSSIHCCLKEAMEYFNDFTRWMIIDLTDCPRDTAIFGGEPYCTASDILKKR